MNHHLPVNIYSTDKSILEKEYVLVYRKADGFSRRLLTADLIVNPNFEYELAIESCEYQPSTGKPFSILIMGNISIEIKEKLEFLLAKKNNKHKLSQSYGRYMDVGSKKTIAYWNFSKY